MTTRLLRRHVYEDILSHIGAFPLHVADYARKHRRHSLPPPEFSDGSFSIEDQQLLLQHYATIAEVFCERPADELDDGEYVRKPISLLVRRLLHKTRCGTETPNGERELLQARALLECILVQTSVRQAALLTHEEAKRIVELVVDKTVLDHVPTHERRWAPSSNGTGHGR